MKSIELNIEKALGTVSKSDVFALEDKAKSGMEMLHKGTGKGNDFLGWLHLPSEITEAHLADLETAAKQLKDRCESYNNIQEYAHNESELFLPLFYLLVSSRSHMYLLTHF